MKVIVHTERGVFSGKQHCDENLERVIKAAADDLGTSLTLETEDGYVIIPRDLLKTSLFEFKT